MVSYPCMEDIKFSVSGVKKLLRNLKNYKTPGPDGIKTHVMKSLSSQHAPTVTMIYQQAYAVGDIPTDWRKANVVPAYKKGSKHDPSNYLPISLTCIACKLFEHIIASNIMKHANENNILYDLQHGFRERRSCETQLIEFTADIISNMQQGHQTDTIILDFSKAFDKVSHSRLLYKLQHYGITGKTNKVVSSFLSQLTQRVALEGEHSYEGQVVSGVPQGSVLGPCLFLFYINDITEGLESTVRLFSDDTILYLAITSPTDATR